MLTVATFYFFSSLGSGWGGRLILLCLQSSTDPIYCKRWLQKAVVQRLVFIHLQSPAWFFTTMTSCRVGFHDAARLTANSGSVKVQWRRSDSLLRCGAPARWNNSQNNFKLFSLPSLSLGHFRFLLMLRFCSHALPFFCRSAYLKLKYLNYRSGFTVI